MAAGHEPRPDEQAPLSVAQLTALIKETLESAFPSVWVSGEMSDISRPQSGHVYFTLKDSQAQIRGVMWRSAASKLRFDLEDGMEVICRGNVDVYPPRGSYQLVVRQIEPRGVGALQLAFQQMQQKLAAEGLFDASHKKSLPRFPRRLAIVTSPTGAAIRDFLEVLRRRWNNVEVLVVPVRVQGQGAAEEIAAGIRLANQIRPQVDTLVVGRGGGSLEDLWSFNEEQVVRAIFASEVPVVSAVGHEIDVTLSDLVSDVRALTPTEAAELIVPSTEETLAVLENYRRRITASLRSRANEARAQLASLAQRRVLRRPLERLHDLARRIDDLDLRGRLAIRRSLDQSKQQLASRASRLEGLSPIAVLGRGYSITHRADDGELVRSVSQVRIGDRLRTRFADGETISRIEQTKNETVVAAENRFRVQGQNSDEEKRS
jgi:exodeoxyribonuclease VII large subunit